MLLHDLDGSMDKRRIRIRMILILMHMTINKIV